MQGRLGIMYNKRWQDGEVDRLAELKIKTGYGILLEIQAKQEGFGAYLMFLVLFSYQVNVI